MTPAAGKSLNEVARLHLRWFARVCMWWVGAKFSRCFGNDYCLVCTVNVPVVCLLKGDILCEQKDRQNALFTHVHVHTVYMYCMISLVPMTFIGNSITSSSITVIWKFLR